MLTRFDPFADFDRLMEQLSPRSHGDRGIPLDIAQGPDRYIVEADLPGVRPDSIDLSVEGNVLTIRAERARTHMDDLQVLASERTKGSFMRQLTVGDGFDLERVTADYTDGVLTVTLPVAEAAKPRRIRIGSRRDSLEAEHSESSGELSNA